ncbi:MAG TPA: ImcF-related family protein, partial [Pseudomonas sp.]|nr:ImcF-related family protein [Pseudomonas sp.]
MQLRRSVGIGVVVGGLLLIGLVLGVVVWRHPESLGIEPDSLWQTLWLSVISATTFIVVMFLGGYQLLGNQKGHSNYRRLDPVDIRQPPKAPPEETVETQVARIITSIKDELSEQHGLLWRFKVRVFLVVGEPAQIQAIAPELATHYWLEGNDTVLIWGGSTQTAGDDKVLGLCKWLTRWRPLEGVVWALNKAQSSDSAAMDVGARHLQALARQLRWQLPLHLWQVCDSQWQQDKRPTQPVGCLLPSPATAQALETSLGSLLDPLRQEGWKQMRTAMGHDFLVRLARDLQVEGIARWRKALEPLWRLFARGVPLRGLWFSLPLGGAHEHAKHLWHVTPPWEGVLGDKVGQHRRLGWGSVRIGYALALGLMAAWGAGLLLSFVSNREHIGEVQTAVTMMQQAQSSTEHLRALADVARELDRLDYRAKHGTPWHRRFGLNRNEQLLSALWPRYVEANNRLMRDPITATLQQQLNALLKLPPESPERLTRATAAYAQLKAYLMLARPDKVDPVFLAQTLGEIQ